MNSTKDYFTHGCNHSNTPKESKHLTLSFCSPRLIIVNRRFLLLGEENALSKAYAQKGESPPSPPPSPPPLPSAALMVLPHLTPCSSFMPYLTRPFAAHPEFYQQEKICTTLWGEKRGKIWNKGTGRKTNFFKNKRKLGHLGSSVGCGSES